METSLEEASTSNIQSCLPLLFVLNKNDNKVSETNLQKPLYLGIEFPIYANAYIGHHVKLYEVFLNTHVLSYGV